MELPISCPLCSQPGFIDVNSLWLNLIRAATSQLSCPVCEEILCGLDKLTIHLMSHSLRDQISSNCFTSNASFSSATPSRCLEPYVPHGSIMASPPASQPLVKGSSPVASYVVINFPPLQSVAMESGTQFTPSEYPNAIENKLPINISSTLRPEVSALSDQKSKNDVNTAAGMVVLESQNPVSTPPGNIRSDTPPPVKNEGRSSFMEKLHCKGSSSSVSKEFKNHQTSLSSAFCEPESNENYTCENLVPGPMVRCQMCGLTFKDHSIASLHQQLMHNICPCEDSEYQLTPKNDDRDVSSKQSPTRSKRGSIASQSRDAANPLHRFPCHICNKVFRMRGSLMVHLRVAHSPSGTVGLTSRLEYSPLHLTLQQGDDISCKLSLQNLSLKETNTSVTTGKELDIFGNVVRKINEQTQLGGSDCMSTMNSSYSTLDDQAVQQSGKKAIQSCLSKTSSSAMTQSSILNPSAVTPVIPKESSGVMFPCAHCNKTFVKEVLLSQHLKSHESKQWECDVCLKSFTTKYFLKKHKRLHTGEMPYTCGICSKSFTFQQSYHKHLLYHSDEKPHSCAECGRAFKELSTLHNHQRIHTGEKPWACETCGKCFRQRVSYLVHRRIHTGAMPYQCTVCLKSFRYKVSQRTHKCAAQQVNDALSSPSDSLHSLLQSHSKEKDKIDDSPSTLEGLFENSVVSKKEQTNLLEKNSLTSSMYFSSFPDCNSPTDSKAMSLSLSSKCEKSSNVEAISQQSSESTILSSIPQTPNYGLASVSSHSSGGETTLETNNLKSVPDFNPEKNSLAQFDPANIALAHSSTCIPLCTPTPSAADFNMDLFQDILSMVMSPTSASAHSPSTQMRHLSLGEDQTDNDFESGLELRQLLYGPCDSDSAP